MVVSLPIPWNVRRSRESRKVPDYINRLLFCQTASSCYALQASCRWPLAERQSGVAPGRRKISAAARVLCRLDAGEQLLLDGAAALLDVALPSLLPHPCRRRFCALSSARNLPCTKTPRFPLCKCRPAPKHGQHLLYAGWGIPPIREGLLSNVADTGPSRRHEVPLVRVGVHRRVRERCRYHLSAAPRSPAL